ncbi:MAG: restriction endonuclease subunit S, partial [Bacteroidales bacterium]|nr:restriction endonuclease subunit S [Bacteroidales bacterium]
VVSFPKVQEQQKIASCLSSLDELIAAHNDKLDALKDHKKGLLQNLFPQEGETVPKVRFPEFEEDGEWVADSLVNIAKFRRGSFPQPYGLPEWYDDEDGMPFIQVYDVDDNFRLKPSTKRKISKLAAEQSVFIEKGTVIITIQGSIGRVAITQYDAYIDRTLLIFQEFYNVIDRDFFAYTLFLLFEIEKQKAPGGIIKTITKQVLSDFTIKIPSLEEQQKIASCLSALDELIMAQAEKIEQLKMHKKGLMQGLFPSAV